MRQDLTDITVIIDRSGSMASCREDAEGGLNQFINDQKKSTGDALFTLIQFDTEYEFIHTGIPVRNVTPFKLIPRGGTSLLDALGRGINETGQRLAAMADDARPGLVVFVILTDGGENSSKEFKKSQIKEMIQHQTDAYKWQFVFLGANQDAFAEAASMGIGMGTSTGYDTKNTLRAMTMTSSKLSAARTASCSGAVVDMAYTDEERKSLNS